jgi:hypothetical protein
LIPGPGPALDATGNAYECGDAERADNSWDGDAAKVLSGSPQLSE